MSSLTSRTSDTVVVLPPRPGAGAERARPAPSVGDPGWSLSRMCRVSLAGGQVLGALPGSLPGSRWVLVLAGGVDVETSSAVLALGEGDAVLVDARTAHRVVATVPSDVVVTDLRATAPDPTLPSPLVVRAFADRHRGVAALVRSCQLGGEYRRTDLFAEGYGALVGAALTASWLEDRPPRHDRWQDPVVADVVAQVAARPGDPWTVARMARLVHLSRSALGERFRRAVGRGPVEVLREVRMREARRLLGDAAHPVEHVAHVVGYGSTAAFSRAFSSHHGVGPRAWRDSRSGQPQGGEREPRSHGRGGAGRERRRRPVAVQERAS